MPTELLIKPSSLTIYKRLQTVIDDYKRLADESFARPAPPLPTSLMFNNKITKTMNALKNKVQLIGRLGQEPEVKQLSNGGTLARFSVATTETYKNKQGERVEDTQWHRVVLWGNLAELAGQYLHKGKEVALEGKLNHRTYDDKDGNKRYITEVVGSDFLMLGKKSEAQDRPAQVQQTVPSDDLPF